MNAIAYGAIILTCLASVSTFAIVLAIYQAVERVAWPKHKQPEAGALSFAYRTEWGLEVGSFITLGDRSYRLVRISREPRGATTLMLIPLEES